MFFFIISFLHPVVSYASDSSEVVSVDRVSGFYGLDVAQGVGYRLTGKFSSGSIVYVIPADSDLSGLIVSPLVSGSSKRLLLFHSDVLCSFESFPFVLGNPLHYVRGFSAGSSYDFSEYLSFSSGYYYMVIDDSNFSGSVSKIMRLSSPEPSPSDSPGVDNPDSRLIFSSFNVDEGDTVYPNDDVRRFSVSPVSVEMSEPNSGTGGYSYILNYHVELPSRFFYRGHRGTAFSNPVVTSDLSIEFYGNGRDGYVYQYSDPVVSLGSDVSHDILDSLSGTSGVITGDVGYALMDIPVRNDISIYSYPLVLDWSVYVSTFEYPAPMINSVEYMCFLDINSITFHRDSFTHVTDSTSDQILDEIHKEQVGQHQEEIDKANEATSAVTDGVTQITGTLSSWEIFTMPVKLIDDFVTAVSSDASSGLTFPSFSMMGYEIWPAYTFDLQVIAEKFPVLYDALHLITGILIFIAFVRYLWRKWSILTGDDMPEGEVK